MIGDPVGQLYYEAAERLRRRMKWSDSRHPPHTCVLLVVLFALAEPEPPKVLQRSLDSTFASPSVVPYCLKLSIEATPKSWLGLSFGYCGALCGVHLPVSPCAYCMRSSYDT